ncbi:MalY/PatB family protein [Mycoplasma yeatsii]|uniref:MalY/PatB family protein n=1 Tax=Mycoplasma yeatsii TaxID=51365 RepID=UPI0005B2410E|nr:aminotransferase class I/II-fold pyridoxal phosphate-dependent enzyme [Mycoplasma yeatsii]AJM72154.1 putative C-S lyase [Mycoplasma yeatsii GM274B]
MKDQSNCSDNFNCLDKLKIDLRKQTKERRWDETFLKANYQLDDYSKVLNCSIADTDFGTPTFISDEIIARANKRSYSYTYIFNESIKAVIEWYKKFHNISLEEKWIRLGNGTVNAMHQAIIAMTNENDSVLIQSPLYKPFERSILSNKRKVVESKLIFDQQAKTYKIDFDDFENKIKTNNVKMFMFCNPHNPGGVRWSKEDINKIIKICEENNVFIFSDEVHGDLVLNNKQHLSLLRFDVKNDFFVVATSPSKLFNLAGLQGSFIITKNAQVYEKINEAYTKSGLYLPNVFSQQAMIAAYTKDETLSWVEKFKTHIMQNFDYVKQNLLDKYSDVLNYVEMECSYVVWVQFNSVTIEEFKENLSRENLVVNIGEDFYNAEKNWFRMNIACPKEELNDLVNRLKKVLKLN